MWSRYELVNWQKLEVDNCPDDLVLVCYEYDEHVLFDLGQFQRKNCNDDSPFIWDGQQDLDLEDIIAFAHINGPNHDYREDLEKEDQPND